MELKRYNRPNSINSNNQCLSSCIQHDPKNESGNAAPGLMTMENLQKRGEQEKPWGSLFLFIMNTETGECLRNIYYNNRGGMREICAFPVAELRIAKAVRSTATAMASVTALSRLFEQWIVVGTLTGELLLACPEGDVFQKRLVHRTEAGIESGHWENEPSEARKISFSRCL